MDLCTILGCIPTIVEYTAAPIKKLLSYAFKYHTKVDELKDAADKLSGQRNQLQSSIDDAGRQARVIYSHVQGQMAKADKAIEDARALIGGEEEEAKQRCFFGMCPNLKRRYKLGKKAHSETLAISRLLDQKTDLDAISYHPPPQQTTTPHAPEGLESRAEILKKVIAALENPKVNMVGLYGQGGVGKTYLAEQVHQQATQNKSLFEDVVMVTVSANPELQRIQEYIAEFLGLKEDFSGLKTNDARAGKLKQRLEKKKVLLILDDLWKNLNLKDIGILFGTGDFRNCKILLTSRYRRTMTEMGAQVIEGLQHLSDAESYRLLEQIVGADELTKVGSTGEEIAKKCFGLPLLIDMNGKYLKGMPLPAWEDKLNKLSNFSDDDLEDKIFKNIDLHYNNLRGEEIKSLFLLCGLLGEFDISMFDLLKYSVGLGLLTRINTLKEARNRLVTLTEHLKSSSLLMNHEKIGFVKIHDMVREAATRIALRDKGVYTMAKDEVWKEWPTKIPDAEQCGWIYIPWRNIHKLPEKLEAPEVQLLALLNEPLYPPSLNVPDSFFDEVNAKLKVVHFAGADFPPTLPPSLRFLTNLHTLCLEDCHVKDVAIIGEMKKLQLLSLRGSDIKQLPKELAHLTQLKLLDLSNCFQLEVIPANVLSKLSALEELLMRNSFDQWEAQDHHNRSNASLADLEYLSLLNTLEVKVHSAEALTGFSFSEKLERYHIEVRDWGYFHEEHESSKTIVIAVDTNIDILPAIQKLLKETETLVLKGLNAGSNIFNSSENEGFPKLKNLFVDHVTYIQYITDYSKAVINGFPILESLKLHNLASLVNICHGELASESFGKLRSLDVYNCNILKYLFSISMVRGLSQLEEINVQECKNMEGIIVNESDNGYYGNEVVQLPLLESFGKLRKLAVSKCNKLKYLFSISMVRGLSQLEEIDVRDCENMEEIIVNESDNNYNGNEAVELPRLESFGKLRSLVVYNCNKLKYLFSISMVRGLSQLEEIDVQECENMEGIIFNESDNGSNRNEVVELPLLESFGKLRSLVVYNCNKLKYLFSISMVRGLSQLEEIDVRKCENMEEIIFNESDNGYYGNEVVKLPRLRDLTLKYLPQLQGFTSKGLLSLFDETVVLPSLEKLAISDCDNFKMLWNNSLDRSSFGELKELLIKNCHNLLTVFPSNILERFHKLEELHIESCDSIEVIYHLQESSVNKTNDSIAGFQLRILRMNSLRKLVHIWSVDLPRTISLKNLRCLVFPQLTELVLDNLPELISFCTDHMLSIEWPQLKFLEATGCEKAFRCTLEQFNAQNSSGNAQGFPNCEEMVLDGSSFTGMMQPSKFQLPSLKSLELRSRIGWWARYPESSLWLHIQRLPNLRELTLETLQLRELMLYPHEVQGGRGGCLKALATHPIPNITVTSNDALIRIMNKTELEKFATNPYIEHVEILYLKACLFLENVAPTLVSNFNSLTSLKISDCHRLISLVTISVATSLVQLKHMDIRSCRMLREILAFDDAAATNNAMQENIVFPKLETLDCYDLPSLRGFYMGSHITLEFPSLEKVYSHRCPKMNVFSCGTLKTPKLEGDLNSTIRDKCLTLKLDPSFPWLLEQWHCEQLPFQVFKNLKTLVVDNCSCFLFAVPWNLLSSLKTLKSLSIERCDSLENVFDPEKLKNEDLRHIGSVALLEHLHLVDLPKLRNVWNKDPHGILDIRNLQVLKVHNCGNLTELFTLSMALDLVHLRDLEVKQCTLLQVVIKKEQDEQAASNSIVFPSLESLYLEYLPSLTSLCSGSYVLNFKGLCKVALVECPNMRICAFTPTTEERDPRDIVEGNEEDSRNYLCFLGCKVEVSNIQELKVEWNNLLTMWTANNQAEFLKNLEVLELLYFPEEDLNSVPDLLQKFSKLKRLVLNSSFFKTIVLSSFNIKDENQWSYEQVLISTSLPCLNHLIVEDSKPIRDFKYPDCLEVSNCNILRILVLPSIYFETLTTLEVSKCHGLINLIASSAARCLVHLKRMTVSECEMVTEIVASKEDGVTVSECEMVTEIVASEEDGAKAEICFRELEHLQLRCLPCLTSFCSGDLCFTFPSLKKVIVIECPKMNTFAPNILSAPLVRGVQIMEDEDKYEDEDDWLWEGSLNSTIEGLYMEMNS